MLAGVSNFTFLSFNLSMFSTEDGTTIINTTIINKDKKEF